MGILSRLHAGERIFTPQEYQELCAEVAALGAAAEQWDDLVLNYRYGVENVHIVAAEVSDA